VVGELVVPMRIHHLKQQHGSVLNFVD